MPTTILVPLDGSSFSEQALRYAVSIAERAGATLHLVKVHVVQPAVLLPEVAVDFGTDLDSEIVQSDIEYLERVAGDLRRRGHDVRTAVVNGAPATALAVYTARANIDLVIMATHGRGGLSRAWLGSVADRLVRSLSIPVLLLKPRDGGPDVAGVRATGNRILIPLDGSETSEAVLEPAVSIGTLIGAQYTLMQVIAPPLVTGVPGVYEQDAEQIRQEAVRYLESVGERLRARGCVVSTSVVMQSQSALGILEHALIEDCTLIAMATHARTGLSRVALGSVTDKVMRTAPVPILISPPAAFATHGADVAINAMFGQA